MYRDRFNRGLLCSLAVSLTVCIFSSVFSISLYNQSVNDGGVVFASTYDPTYTTIVNKTVYESALNDEYTLSELKADLTSINASNIDYQMKKDELQSEYEEAVLRFRESQKNKVETSNSVVVPEGSLALPSIEDTSFKGYMCLHTVTSTTSYQYKFLHSGDYEFTTNENGILMYGDYYVVAMASYYTGYKVGSTFRITLDSGIVFDVITGDEKADCDTDANHMYRPKSEGRGEIIEFIVACGMDGKSCNQYHTMTGEERALGSLSSLGFQGNVVKIEKLDDYSVSDALYG